jgi:histidyl-tRNA synthetase
MAISDALRNLHRKSVRAFAVYGGAKKFKKQMEYANKIGARFVVIIGDDEVKSKTVALKNMATGVQVSVDIQGAIKIINQK